MINFIRHLQQHGMTLGGTGLRQAGGVSELAEIDFPEETSWR
jgi:hypothetical protein